MSEISSLLADERAELERLRSEEATLRSQVQAGGAKPARVGGHDRGSATLTAEGPGRGQPGAGPFADVVAFELGQGGKDMEDELAARGGGIDRFLEASEPDPALRQAGDGVDQVPE